MTVKKNRYKEINVKDFDNDRIMIEFKERSFSDIKWLSIDECKKLLNDLKDVLKGDKPVI